MSAEATAPKQRVVGRPFVKGQSGNPLGRPKGSKNELVENFIADLRDAWLKSGKKAIDAMIVEKPGDFVKVVAGLVPKDVNLNINPAAEMTDEELTERVRSLASQLAPFLHDGTGTVTAGVAGEGGAKQPSRVH